jgi:hypothetical protein
MHRALVDRVVRPLLVAFFLLGLSGAASAQVSVGISVGFAPPPLPVYEQPICPEDGYIWTPGYWAWDGDDYYWVPGTWVAAPEVGFLWTPAWWGWGGNAYIFHAGYWGPHVGWYGGISYGYGYFGRGYEGGRWDGGHFFYNREVNNVNVTVIHNVYNTRIEHTTVNRVSYNGGNGGINARPSRQEEEYSRERHVGPVAAQTQHYEAARGNRDLRASVNQGKPPVAATSRPGEFKGGAVGAREAGGPYKAPERSTNARPGNEARPETNGARSPGNNHASEVQAHKYTAPTSGNAEVDRKYQQQQEKLAAKQNQEHQKLQQQQEKEHQQAARKTSSDAQKQQMEQRHTQQTQQLEQKHATQQQKIQTRQQPHQNAARPPEGHPEKH